MEILVMKERIAELEAKVEDIKAEVIKKIKAFEIFLTKFEGGKKVVKKTKED